MIMLELFIAFMKIGLFTVGGGYAMIPLMQQEILNRNWLTLEGIVDIIAIAEMTPGPFAINVATFVGIQTAGLAGALAATAGVIFPSFVLMLIIAKTFTHFKDHPVVQGLLHGLRPAVIGLIAAAAYIIGKSIFLESADLSGLPGAIDWRGLLIFLPAAVAVIQFKVHPVLVTLLCAGAGMLLYGVL